MRACLYLDPSRIFRWHLWLAQSLAAVPGCELFCAFTSEGRPLPLACRLLFDLERLIYGLPGDAATDPIVTSALPSASSSTEPFDLVICLADDENVPSCNRMLRPLFNGLPGEIGAINALVDGRTLCVEIRDTSRPFHPWTAHPASGDRGVFAASLDSVLSCATELIAKATRIPGGVEADTPRESIAAPARAFVSLTLATRMVTNAATRLVAHLASGGRAWTVGWRFDQGESLMQKRRADFTVLSGGARCFYADPFPFEHEGRHFIFMEEFPYDTGRGCISVAEIQPDGQLGQPQVVLDEPHHLSYPFVFHHGGQIWMIPESGEAKQVTLYRADPFPYRWTCEAILIDEVQAFDATLLPHSGRLWLLASVRFFNSTGWDALALYHAPDLTGPWAAHTQNPMLIDATLGRPAGKIFSVGDDHVRPVQDCSRGYGSAITICRLDKLDECGFTQVPIGRIECSDAGCHTYNRHAGLEVIDLFCSRRHGTLATASYRPGSLSPESFRAPPVMSVPRTEKSEKWGRENPGPDCTLSSGRNPSL